MSDIIDRQRSVIIALDTADAEVFRRTLHASGGSGAVGGYKVGFASALLYGLPYVTEEIRSRAPGKAIIYDHQKAARDIALTGELFAQVIARSGIDAAILYPNPLEPDIALAWIGAAQKRDVRVIFGSWMTSPRYASSEAGPYHDDILLERYRQAAIRGVSDFVVPGNKIDAALRIRDSVLPSCRDPVLYAPGFGRQGGDIARFAARVPGQWHAIIGTSLLERHDLALHLGSLEEHLS